MSAPVKRQKAETVKRERVTCPACFGTEDDCDSCNGRGYFMRTVPNDAPKPQEQSK